LSRLAPLDKAWVLILVPLWVVCFGLAVKSQVEGEGVALLGLTVEDADSYPVLTGQFSIQYSWDPLDQAGLQPGDRLIRVGDADLRGVGTVGLVICILEEAGRDPAIPLVFDRDGARRTTSLDLLPVSSWRPLLAASFAFAVSALFLLLRARPTPSVRAYFHLGMCTALGLILLPGVRLVGSYASVGITIVTFAVWSPLMVRFVRVFPADAAPEGRRHRIWPWLFAPPVGLFAALVHSGWMRVGQSGLFLTGGLGVVAFLVVATRKYRRADPVARRQMKWILFGTYCAALPMGLAGLSTLEPRLGWLAYASWGALALVPLSMLVSVARFNLFDVDRILSATASYNILAVLLGAGTLILVPRIAEAVSGVAGVDPTTGQVMLSLALAAVVIPAHSRLRPQIDRVFFKDRYALDHGIAELLPTLSSCTDVRELTERAGAGLYGLLRPEACVVYAGVERSYAPVFAEGQAVPPAFEADSLLIGTLRERRTLLSLSNTGRRPDEAHVGPFDRAALETLGAELVVPVWQDDALAAFVCLGPKRSGDVYTSTDLSLLAAVAEKVSTELHRFDQDEVIREGREMQESLRRYVPGAVAEQLSSGAELASGEREVTVLFVDIRGYTGFSESRKAEEIFSTVNRYTETVSQIVQRHGGCVVEFNGDGMMTVFGAPRELAHKERAAVEAGREIVEAVAALSVEAATGGQTKLSVGVGIATGEAFVGNIQAVDRMIWSAIGNTTNLAARLQSLTRDFDAPLVIDPATWERARPASAGFEKRPDVPIRGRREAQDLYLLAMPGAS
jgi:class 3 adenylate cyclase